jgi:hypothetical protein
VLGSHLLHHLGKQLVFRLHVETIGDEIAETELGEKPLKEWIDVGILVPDEGEQVYFCGTLEVTTVP